MLNYDDIARAIGLVNTPLVRYGDSKVFAKHEQHNITGSIKVRPALAFVVEAVNSGLLGSSGTIVEASSGNMGIALAYIGQQLGYKVVITMPDSMSVERIKMLEYYGATIDLTPGSMGMRGALDRALYWEREQGAFFPRQFDNNANVMIHANTTAREIITQMNGDISVLVAGVGTGGTLTGVGTALKQYNPNIKIIAVEPSESAVLGGAPAGKHGIQGIGAGFVPSIVDRGLIDDIVTVSTDKACDTAKMLISCGWGVGLSSGANMAVALELAQHHSGNIVTVCPDSSDRYGSVLSKV